MRAPRAAGAEKKLPPGKGEPPARFNFPAQPVLKKEKGIPFATFDGDQADPRVFSKAQYETRVQGLTEVMDERIAQRE